MKQRRREPQGGQSAREVSHGGRAFAPTAAMVHDVEVFLKRFRREVGETLCDARILKRQKRQSTAAVEASEPPDRGLTQRTRAVEQNHVDVGTPLGSGKIARLV